MLKKNKLLSMVIAATVTTSIGITAFAAMESHVLSGGWSESRGYYINNVESSLLQNKNMPITPYASDKSDKHTGERLKQVVDSAGTLEFAAFGETVWYDVYHYTTAQMELSNGTVKTTSGRQWDDNATKATSPWYRPGLFENTEARTYWGR